MRKVILTILVTMLLVFAAWQNPTPIYVGPGDQTIDVVISDGEGGAAVIWWDDVTEWNYMQVIDSAGNLKWGAEGVPIIATAGLSTQNPDVFQDDEGNYWVALEGNGDIYVQKLSPTGQRLFGDDGVAVCTEEGEQDLTSICTSNGGAIVVWGDLRTSPSHSYTQRLDVDGQIKWAVNGVMLVEPDYSGSARLVPDNHGGAFYIYRRLIDTENHIAGQRLDSLGIRLWGDSGIVYVKGSMHPQFGSIQGHMTKDDSGGFMFFYDEGSYYRANRVDSLGFLLWDTSSVLLGHYLGLYNGSVSPFSLQGFYVVQGLSVGSSSEAVYAHKLTLDGETPWADTGVLVWNVWAYDPRVRFAPSVNENGTIAWRDVYDAGDPYGDRYEEQGIMAQRIDPEGNILWSEEILVCGTSGSNPKTVSTFDEGSIIVWQDIRNASSDIYSAHVDSAGNISGIEEHPFVPAASLEVEIPLVSNTLFLRYSLPLGKIGTLKLFNATGRLVRTQRLDQPSGKINWNVQDLSSGVYFAELRAAGARVSRKVVVVR